MAVARCGNALFRVNIAYIVFTVLGATMYASLTISKITRVLVASILAASIFVVCPLSASAASKKGGGSNTVQSNPAKRSTANSLGTAGTAGATQGAGGGAGGGGTGPGIKGESKDDKHGGWIYIDK
jgi:hypothetical protein